MIRRIINFFRRRRLERRGFFCFVDQGRLRAVDPIRAARGLLHDPEFNLETQFPFLMANQEPEASNGVQMACRVFGVERWSEATRRGLTDGEIIGLLLAFKVFLDDQKKSIENGPNSSNALDSASSTGSPTPPGGTGDLPLASGSISIESTTGSHGGPCGECSPVSNGQLAAN